MKVKYLGTGAAEGIPAMFCTCVFCTGIRKKGQSAWRTRSQVLIDDELSVDFPPEAYYHAMRFNVDLSAVKNIIVTHSHMDHCYAHDFVLRGYKYAAQKQKPLVIYGNAEVLKVFNECTRREMKPEVAANITLSEMKPYNEYFIGDYRVLALPAKHSKVEDALLFYIERSGKGYLHLYDTGIFDKGVYDYLANAGARANLVSLDCTFVQSRGGENARHMGIDDDMDVISGLKSAGVCNEQTKYVITHFSHNAKPTDELLDEIERGYGVKAAYDGMVIDI